jgi:Immunoglobulin domain/Immunoglobulin I-set domain
MRGCLGYSRKPAAPSIRKFNRILLFGVLLSVLTAAPLIILSGCAGVASSSTSNPPSAPAITTQPASQAVAVGQTATFSVAAAGTTPLSYQWKKGGVNVSGATSPTYTTPPATSSDSGSAFTAVVQNTAGAATSTAAMLTVTTAPVAPTITTQPASQTVSAGQTATFTVVAAGTAPLSYQWQKNGANITGATATSYTTPATASSDSGSTFDVTVSNTAGTITSTAAALIVNAAAVAPTITTQPAAQTVTVGQTATFTVVAAGTAPLSYQWQRNGANITGATATSYTTPATASSDSGSTFDVTVSNTAGTIMSAAAALTVTATPVAPTITTQPASQTVTAGQTATFMVVAAGTAPLSYQWQKNGANITGATATSYTTPATVSSDSGSTFDVTVSNTAGTITSTAAALTVNAAVQHSVALTWNASPSTVAGYNVYRTTTTGENYVKINPSLVPALDYTDSTVQGSTTYYYVTTAVDSSGNESGYSNEAPAPIP